MDMVSAGTARSDSAHCTGAAVADFDEISGIIAHEISQPLTAILGDAEAGLRSLGDSGAVRDILTDIIASVQRAAEIVRRARIMLQEGGPRCQAHSLNELVLATLRVARGEIVKRAVSVELHLGNDMECVRVDRIQIEQVILNLIVNACEGMETTPAGWRRLRIATRRNPHRAEIELRIEDSGAGIAAEERERIFQPFVSSKPGGLGLGLAICRFIVRAHGGDLWAEAARRGARICMRLPKTAPFVQVDWITAAGLSR